MAETLAEPRPALPQDESPPSSFVDPAPMEVLEVETDENDGAADAVLEHCPEDWHGTNGSAQGPNGSATPSADAFVKLREMLAQLRQPGQAASVASATPQAKAAHITETAAANAPDVPPFQVPASLPLPVTLPGPSSPFQIATATVKGTVLPHPRTVPKPPATPGNALQGRYQALRLQHQAEAHSQPLDHSRLADLIRLAGRRFPLVRFSEHELPGLPGRMAFYWALQGIEVLFGLAPFSDALYWRTLGGFAAGRLTDLATQAEREGREPARLKIVGFKTEREQLSWQNLLHSQLLPESIRQIADIVHLDTDGLASLYAMQRIIKESESGVLQAEPAQVISVLARELDFFWKRITRVR
jgi:hypothetical protein